MKTLEINMDAVVKCNPSFPIGSNSQSRFNDLVSFVECREKIKFVKALRDWYRVGLKEAKYLADDVFAVSNIEDRDNVIRQIADGVLDVNHSDLIQGVEVSLRNWKVLGYATPQHAVIDYMERSLTLDKLANKLFGSTGEA